MLKVYGSEMCSDCRNCKLNFDKFKIDYSFIDINSSLKNLKEFLYLREHYDDVFKRLKDIGDIGLPAIIDNEKVFTDWESYLINLGHNDLIYEETKKSCSIDHKGC